MPVSVTVLCENAVYGALDLVAEHGWAAWIETPSGNYLLDAGQGLGLAGNAAALKKDLRTASAIALSHHHIDHTGGLMKALKAARPDGGRIKVHAHPGIFKTESYSDRPGKPMKKISMPFSKEELERAGADFVLGREWREIGEDVWLSGEVPRRNEFETGDIDLKERQPDGTLAKDPVLDDQSLIADTPKGLLVVLGCSHAGIVNILTHIAEKTGRERFAAVVGGTHLGMVSEAQASSTLEALRRFKIERLGVSHCTGPKVAARLAQEFGDGFLFCNVGAALSF